MTRALLGLAAAAVLTPAAQAQVVREDGVKSIAGVVSLAANSAEWTFRSGGGEILFASIDGDLYKESVEHQHTGVAAAAAEEEEEEGGPGLFRLAVIDQSGNPVCTARRPTPPPGWQRDPRMACILTTAQTYRVRVELVVGEHVTAAAYPFLLNLSLRTIARTGTNVQSAFATSQAAPF
jgi:hypothetical protein